MSNTYSYMFFNCDEYASSASMNPICNCIVYRKKAGKRALWREIKQQIAEEQIEIEKRDLQKIRNAILFDNPCEANDFMTYGHIIRVMEAI